MNLTATIVDFTSDDRFRSSRTCEGGIHMGLDRPVHAPEAAEGTTEPAVALHAAPGTAVHGGLTLTLTPDFQPRLAGGRS